MTIAISLIATRKYKQFINSLLEGIKQYFLLDHKVNVYLFIDELGVYVGDSRVKIYQDLIPSYGFPGATLRRYEIMTSRQYECDYLYYLDVDYRIVSEIDEEIFGDIVAVLHPGFSCVGGGSWCTDKNSNAYTYPEFRIAYYCGGTQGGRYEYYYPIMKRLAREIADDEKRGVRAEWNDESHWNKYLSEHKDFKTLDSSYCMVEQPELRKKWNIDHLEPKIIALAKDHAAIRQ